MSASTHARLLRPVAILGAALAMAACASGPSGLDADRGPTMSLATMMAKLTRNLTGAQVSELLGPPAAIKEIKAAGVKGEAWSYPFRGTPDVRMVPIGTQELPATNPLTGQSITRTETVYQNQEFEVVDTLHLLIVEDRLIEWSVVRTEKKKFQ